MNQPGSDNSPQLQVGVELDFRYHDRIPFNADIATAVHRWCLINESQSLAQIKDLFHELGLEKGDLVIDPFCGSGAVALQCALEGADFLGFDLLPICVIGTRAKLAAATVDVKQFATHVTNLERVFHGHLHSSRAGTYETYQELLSKILDFGDKPETWIFLNALFAAGAGLEHRSINGSSGSELATGFGHRISCAMEDLKHTKFFPGSRRVFWQSGIDTDWTELLNTKSRRAFLITSPPFSNSLQDDDIEIAEWQHAAGEALLLLGETPLQPPKEEISDYFNLAAACLTQLSELEIEHKAGVFECRCDHTKTSEFPVDVQVGSLAANQGFGCSQVRITHYVDKLGSLTSNPTKIRGSLVFFGINCS